uniref:Uncharacterized protein n=1 Tax=Escherichia coli TaxID=562 RepID=A0A7D5JWN8_ECOLX|nr:hypothetical protein pE0272_2_00121 [Escherichia coli]
MMVVRSGKALSRDNRANRRMEAIFVQSIFHRAIASGCTNAACSDMRSMVSSG